MSDWRPLRTLTRGLVLFVLIGGFTAVQPGGAGTQAEAGLNGPPNFTLTPNHAPCYQEVIARGTNLTPGGKFVLLGPLNVAGAKPQHLNRELGTVRDPDGTVGPDGTVTIRITPCTVSTITRPINVIFELHDSESGTASIVTFTVEPTTLPGIPNTGAGGTQPRPTPVNGFWLAIAIIVVCVLARRNGKIQGPAHLL